MIGTTESPGSRNWLGEPTSCAHSDEKKQPDLLQVRRRRIIALAWALLLIAILVAFVVFGPPSVAASGGCGGG